MSRRVTSSYLTCTAAQADEFNVIHPHGIVSLNQLLEGRAGSHPDVLIAGFPERSAGNRWGRVDFTYASLLSASNTVAHYYLTTGLSRIERQETDRIIGLLSPSCAEFLVTLFAVLRLGYGVLLLAPQNTPKAIRHLCKVTSCTHLICCPSLMEQGREAISEDTSVHIVNLAPRSVWRNSATTLPLLPLVRSAEEEKDLTALVMHTSGSTGMPKAIYHPHRIWTEAIPCMPGKPAFSTTPLFHGGSADLLRSMNALSTLYLFPSTYPVTVTNIIGAISVSPDVTAFMSVPWILKLLAEDQRGMEMLCRMELVSTGGAPLPEALGDQMVQQSVRLVSRLGSSECGFLMSSHRDYKTDHEWSWLRNEGPGEKILVFAPVADSENTYELIVPKVWSTRVVSNRDDGSFATGDLYTKHPTLPHAWRYSGRVDDMVVMTNGKKTSANPIETALRASPHIAEAIVFGAGRPALGVLIVPASSSTPEEVMYARLHEVNQTGASYAQIPDGLVVILPWDAPLPKTSKGSVVRPRALVQYADVVEAAYARLERGEVQISNEGDVGAIVVDQAGVKTFVRGVIEKAAALTRRGKGQRLEIDDDEDLFALGIDSVQAITIRSSLQRLVSSSGAALASNVVFEHSSVNRLVTHILGIQLLREGTQNLCTEEQRERQYEKMRELLDKYGSFTELSACIQVVPNGLGSPPVIVLTGVTGALGAHVLSCLHEMSSCLRLVALVRAEDDIQAKGRVEASLRKRKLPPIEVRSGLPVSNSNAHAVEVCAMSSDLTKDDLGLGEVYLEVVTHLECVFHVAWPVNFALGVDSFAPILKGTQNLINLASRSPRGRLIFCSSIASVSQDAKLASGAGIPETLSLSEASAAPMGYAQSKWVAEHVCSRGHKGPLPRRVAIARLGQLCGDTIHGVWNESEGWPLIIASTRYVGCLPDFVDHPSWLPVDIAARALVDIWLSWKSASDKERKSDVLIYHVVNPSRTTSWADILDYLHRSGLLFDRTCPTVWIRRLKEREPELDSATRNLLGMWESKFCDLDSSATNVRMTEPKFDTSRAYCVSASMKQVEPISEQLVRGFVNAWRTSGFLPPK